jgi:GntR family transcriptional repressor for pyruvate dehydrogenase complex
MKIEQIKSYSAPERVVRQFLQNLATGEMQAGQKLPTQDRLSELFGVSRSSIREAMNALAMMGYLEITQGRGSFIKQELPNHKTTGAKSEDFFENANLFNLLEIREVLECYAVEKAASVASEADIEVLQNIVKRLENSNDDLREFLLADMEFHMAIGRAANLPEIGDLVKSVHQTVNKKLPVVFSASKKDRIAKSIDTARDMLQHITGGEGRKAARCMRNHLSMINNDLKEQLLASNAETGIRTNEQGNAVGADG